MNKTNLLRRLSHFVFRTGRFKQKCIKTLATSIHNKKILELGSGKQEKGKYTFSDKQFFDNSNEFIRSDVVALYGHRKVDVTLMNYKAKFDVILCLNVLEHVFEFNKAIINIHKALKRGGMLVLFVPVFYPLHDEPHDYWRFTEHALRRLLKMYGSVKITHSGLRAYPFAYYVEAVK